VLLHGLGDSHDLWRHQMDALATGHRVIAFDLRGHGRSPLGQADFDLGQMAGDVRAMLDELGIARAMLVGLSMGGGVAQTLAIAEPERALGLVLVSTSSEFPDATQRRFLDRAARAEEGGMAAVVDETVPRWFTPAFTADHPDEVERTRRTVLAIDPAAFAAASRANARRNLTRDLHRIRCPIQFVGGSMDPADPERALGIYRRELPDVRAEIVDGVSHLLPVEAPATFNRIVLDFIAEVERITQ
jgi:3-oxoadipate enol-lactonase